MNEQHVEIKIMVTALNANHRCQPPIIRTAPDGSQFEEQRDVIDPTIVLVGFTLPENQKAGDEGGMLRLRNEDARKLSLMIGDILTLNIVKNA